MTAADRGPAVVRRTLTSVLIVPSLLYLLGAFAIDTPAGQYAAVGPQAFPLVIGLGLLLCAVWITLRPATEALPVDWGAGVASAATFLGYLLLLAVAGYLVSTVLFIVMQSRLLGSHAWRRDLLVGVLVTAVVYGLFQVFLRFPLPAGVFG